jgi:hypothetical protein
MFDRQFRLILPFMQWQPIATAPFESDLQLAVIDVSGTHALVFPCRRAVYGWVSTKAGVAADVHPTHWREWDDSFSPISRS